MENRRKVIQALSEGKFLLGFGAGSLLDVRVIEKAGFDFVGLQSFQFCADWGVPDVGIKTPTELLDYTFRVTGETDLPTLIDMEDGWGAPFQAAYWLRQFERAGATMVHIDDLSGPFKCPFLPGHDVELAPMEETANKIRAMVDARQDGIIIHARTWASLCPGFAGEKGRDEDVRRLQAYKEAGADIVWTPFSTLIEGDIPGIRKQLGELKGPFATTYNVPTYGFPMGDFMPYATFEEMRALGVQMIIVPQVYQVGVKALYDVLTAVKQEGNLKPFIGKMATFDEILDILKYDDVVKSVKKYS